MLRSILDETVERLHRELRSQPVVAAGLRETLGNVYRDLNELRAAALMHETALQMRREIHGPEHVIVAGLLANFAETLARQDRLTEAETMLREALAMRERLQGRDDADVVTTRAALENVRLRQRQAGQSRGEPVPTHRAPPVGGALGSDSVLPGDLPLVIRIAHTGGRSTGQTFNSGNLISTADQLDVLEREFAADGVPVKWLYFPGGAATHEAMARGEVDFASWGYLAQAKGLDQKLLLRPGSNGTGLNYLITRADAPYESLDDLVGRSLGSVKGTAGHLHLCRILERHGFAQADFTIKFYPGAAALSAALQAEEVDGYYMTRPAQLVATGKAKVIHDATGEVPQYDSGGGFLVSGEFERRHPAVVQRVVTAIVKLAAWHSDERNREEIFAAWSKAGRDREEMERSWAAIPLKERYSPLLDAGYFATMHRNVDDSKRFGLISEVVNLDGWAEPKYLERALVELGLADLWPECDAEGRPIVGGASHPDSENPATSGN